MPGIPALLILVLSATAACGAWGWHRLRLARAEAAAALRLAEARARCLGLLAQDLQAPGLALLGHAGSLPPPAASAVAAEARTLLQVLGRAARMTRDGDWIDLRPQLTPDSLAIIVEDEGAGLGAEDLACGQATEADRTRGLGFGLAVARSLLEAHGGALRLEALPGVGARAWLTLPRECVVA